MYAFFEHTADLGLRLEGDDLPALLRAAGQGLTAVIVAHPERVKPRSRTSVSLRGEAPDDLLLDWLNELLFLFEAKRWVGADFEVRVERQGLEGVLLGELFDPGRHGPAREVKAITYHGLKVVPGRPWRAEVILDI